nr:MAG: RNA-dependent RNA polymerase [Wufeng bat phenuivirus 1]
MQSFIEKYSQSVVSIEPTENTVHLILPFFDEIVEQGSNTDTEDPAIYIYGADVLVADWVTNSQKSGEKFLYAIQSVPDSVSNSSTIYEEQECLPFEKARSFPHDYTFSFLSPSTDLRLTDFFTMPFTPQTPDCIMKLQNVNCVLEFTTCQADSEQALRRAVSLKWAKYMPDIQTIQLKDEELLAFHIIAVSPTHVASTLPLNFDLVNELCLRYRLARSIYIQWNIINEDEIENYQALSYLMSTLEADPLFTTPDPDRCDKAKELGISIVENYVRIAEKSPKSPLLSEGSKVSTDPVLRLPLAVAENQDFLFNLAQLPFLKPESIIGSVWAESINFAKSHPERFESGQEYENENYEEVIGEMDKKVLRNRYRVDPILLSTESYHIGLDGVNAKYLKKVDAGFRSDIDQKRKHKQEAYAYDTPTNDIDEVLDSPWWFLENHDVNSVYKDLFTSLSLSTQDNFTIEYDLMRKNLLTYATFVSIIAQQLVIAKQKFCRSTEFVLQPVPGYKSFMLVKPTSAEGHLFFSLLLKTTDDLKTSLNPKNVIEIDQDGNEWMICEFQSVKFSTLENWIKLPYLLLSSYFTLSEITEKQDDSAFRRLIFPLLMSLSNKSETEEVVTLSRYVYMEMFRLRKNPYKILTKVPTTVHSRLTVWAVKKLLFLCDYINTSQVGVNKLSVKTLEDPDNELEVSQNSSILPVPAMCGHYMLSSLDEILADCYAGYWVNKNQDQEQNQNLKLYKKIFLMESKLVDDINCNQTDGVYSGKYHEWDSRLLDCALAHCNAKLARMLGQNFKQVLQREFLSSLSKTSLLELATLKSSNTSSREIPYTPRSKVLPQIYQNIDGLGSDMASALRWAFDKVEESGFLINIFKKAQHGGIREISIMNLQSRIIQYSIELLSKTICSKFEEEAMTHPSAKNSPIIKHLKKMIPGSSTDNWLSFFTSSDAEKWNQTLSAAKFDYMLCQLLPEDLHGFIHKSLDLWTKKEILLDKFTYENLQRPDFVSRDPVYNEISRRVQEGAAPFQPNHPFMLVQTGMLQGLLHFTSSLFHVIILDYWRSLVAQISHGSAKVSFLVSSDDAGVIYSIKASQRTDIIEAYSKALKYEALRLAILEHSGVRTSFEKTTFLSPDVFEFNSIWNLGLSQARASSKFALACITLSDTGTLASRQEQLCSSRQQLLESGICIKTTREVCFTQGLFYYAMLGAFIHPLFGRWLEIVTMNQDFFSGWFLVDPKMLSGIVTVDYILWDLCSRTNYGAVLAGALNETHFEKGVTKSGATLLSSHASFVRSKTYKAILSKMENRDTVMQMLNDNPAVLFRKPANITELRAAILSNYTSTKVVYSLARDRQYEARVFASSAYMISSPCMTLGTAWLEDLVEDNLHAFPKVSLLQLASKQKKTGEYNDEVRRIFFPNVKEYERIQDLSSRLSAAPLRRLNVSLIKNHTRVVVVHGSVDYACSLLNACVWKWGYETPRVSAFALDNVWGRFQMMYPWLKNDLQSTLESGDFLNVLQLKETLAHESSRSHILNVNTCNAYGRSSNLLSFIRNNWCRGYRLASVHDVGVWPRVQHLVTQCAWIQPSQRHMDNLFRDLMLTEYNERTVPERLKPYWVWAKSENADSFLREININSITLGGYERRGIFSSGTYTGRTTWEGTVKGCKIRVVCDNSKLLRVDLEGTLTTYYRIKEDLKVLFSDHLWDFQTMMFHDQAVIRSNFQAQFLTGKYCAVPLVLCNTLEIKIDPFKLEHIEVHVSSLSSLRLIGHYRDRNRRRGRYTLYSSRFYEHLETAYLQNVVSGPLAKLIQNEPLTFPEFRSFVMQRHQTQETQSVVSMFRNLIHIHWLAQKPFQSHQGVYQYDEEVDIFENLSFDAEGLAAFATDDVDMYFDCSMMDMEQVENAVQNVEQAIENANVIQGLEITEDLIMAVTKPETVTRSEYLKLIRVLPVDRQGRKFRKAVIQRCSSDPSHISLASVLGLQMSMKEEDKPTEVEIDF